MSHRIIIRPARGSHDQASVVALCDEFLGWCRMRYGANSWMVDRYYSPEKWAAVLAELSRLHEAPDGEILLAHLDERPVGCVMMQRMDAKACEMKRLYVRDEGRGFSVGRRLCEELMRTAAERGYSTMRLDTGRPHDEALALYESLGFRRREPYYDAPAELARHLVFMEAQLG